MKFPRQVNLWLPSYLSDRAGKLTGRKPAKRLWVALTDHFEPMGGNVPLPVGLNRMGSW